MKTWIGVCGVCSEDVGLVRRRCALKAGIGAWAVYSDDGDRCAGGML